MGFVYEHAASTSAALLLTPIIVNIGITPLSFLFYMVGLKKV